MAKLIISISLMIPFALFVLISIIYRIIISSLSLKIMTSTTISITLVVLFIIGVCIFANRKTDGEVR